VVTKAGEDPPDLEEKKMSVSIRILVIWAAVLSLALAASVASADAWSWNFESGLGHNAEAIGSASGLVFSTTTPGGNMYYADINSGWYSVTSDNGKVYPDGQYFVSGDVAAYLVNPSDGAKISFAYGKASYFKVGYSSLFNFTLLAYDAAGQLLDQDTGLANTKGQGGTGLRYLEVSCPDIAYVVLHDSGGFWMIDNIETDAPVPEPASLVVLAVGLAALMVRRRRPA